jgi:hypothetical protein
MPPAMVAVLNQLKPPLISRPWLYIKHAVRQFQRHPRVQRASTRFSLAEILGTPAPSMHRPGGAGGCVINQLHGADALYFQAAHRRSVPPNHHQPAANFTMSVGYKTLLLRVAVIAPLCDHNRRVGTCMMLPLYGRR